MCITALSIEDLENIKAFKYRSTDSSIFYNYLLSPCLNKVVSLLPMKLAPNNITILALGFNIVSFLITNFELYNDFEEPLSRTVCFIQFAAHMLYIIFDNLDGKQARRTGTSSAYGMLLDHGCDVFTNILVCYNVSHYLQLGNEGPFSYMIFSSLLPGFFALTYEEYVLQELHLGLFNGADEGNLIVAVGALVGGIFPEIYTNEIWILTVGEWCALLTLLGTVHCIVMSLFNIFFSKGMMGIVRAALDWLPFYTVIITPMVISNTRDVFFADYFWLVMLTVSLLFARLTMDLQVRIVTKQRIGVSIIVIGVNVALIVSYFLRKKFFLLTIFGMSSVCLGTEIAMLVCTRSIEILTFLKLKLLCIQPNL